MPHTPSAHAFCTLPALSTANGLIFCIRAVGFPSAQSQKHAFSVVWAMLITSIETWIRFSQESVAACCHTYDVALQFFGGLL